MIKTISQYPLMQNKKNCYCKCFFSLGFDQNNNGWFQNRNFSLIFPIYPLYYHKSYIKISMQVLLKVVENKKIVF